MVAMRQSRSRSASPAGFTLLEILIVVLILGVLSGLAIFAILGAQRTATRQACEADWRNASLAVTSYKSDNPTSFAGLGLPGNNTIPDLSSATNPLATQGYMSKLTANNKYSISLVFAAVGAADWQATPFVTPNGAASPLPSGTIVDCQSLG